MMELSFHEADTVKRRMMFALELIDPGRGLPAGREMSVRAEGFGPPGMTRAGQFVWTDPDPPADRDVKVKATPVRGWFQPYEATIHVPKRTIGVPAVVKTVQLEPTGLYEPPAGRLAAAGMLIDDPDPAERNPLEGVSVVLQQLARDDNSILQSELLARTDHRGGFVAMASDFGALAPRPSPPPAAVGGLVGWLALTMGGATRYSGVLPLRQGRLLRIADPLAWKNLSGARPPPP